MIKTQEINIITIISINDDGSSRACLFRLSIIIKEAMTSEKIIKFAPSLRPRFNNALPIIGVENN